MFTDPILRPSLVFVQPDISNVGLRCQYKFNGNAMDSSGNGYNGVPVNSPSFNPLNVLLNGSSQRIDINAVPIQSYPFTVNCWFNPSSGGFIWSETATSAYTGFYCSAYSTGVSLNCDNGTTATSSSINTTITGWNMVTYVFSSATSRTVILNANIAGAYTDTTNSTPAMGSVNDNEIGEIGGIWAANTFNNWYGGLLTDFRIYSRVLTNAEIVQLYNNQAQ